MFTKAELLEQFESLHLKPLHLLKGGYFNSSSHPSLVNRGSEESYAVYRGLIQDFEEAMQFYCNSIVEWDAQSCEFNTWEKNWHGWVRGEIQTALCLPITQDEFLLRSNQILGVVRHLVKLPAMDDFVDAMQMQDEWNDTAVLAQFKDEYIYMQWSTSA